MSKCKCNTETKGFPFILNRPMDKEIILPSVTSFIGCLFAAIEKGTLCKGQLLLFPVHLLSVETLKKKKKVVFLVTQSMKVNSNSIVYKCPEQFSKS